MNITASAYPGMAKVIAERERGLNAGLRVAKKTSEDQGPGIDAPVRLIEARSNSPLVNRRLSIALETLT